MLAIIASRVQFQVRVTRRCLVAQSAAEHPLIGHSKELQLSDIGSNCSHGWQEKILAVPSKGKPGKKFTVWEKVEEKSYCYEQ